MKTILEASRSAVTLYPSLFNYWRPLVAIHFVSYLFLELMTSAQERVLQSGKEDLPAIFLVFAGSAVVEIGLATVWVVTVIRVMQANAGVRPISPQFLSELNFALIESVRSIARALRWLPVLIIPAIVKFVRLTFVPFIVTDLAAYKEGSIDALNESERITKNHFWLVVFALLVNAFLVSAPALFLHGTNISLASRPLASITWSVFEFFASLLATAFLYCLYRKLVSQAELPVYQTTDVPEEA